MTIETDHSTARQWSESHSPLCAVKEYPMTNMHNDLRAETVREIVRERYSHLDGAEFAAHRAANAVRAGESAHRSLQVAEESVSVTRSPVTEAYNQARDMGLTDIHCTADGVAGHYTCRAGQRWRMTIAAEREAQ